jgi:hypothetical protein
MCPQDGVSDKLATSFILFRIYPKGRQDLPNKVKVKQVLDQLVELSCPKGWPVETRVRGASMASILTLPSSRFVRPLYGG